MRNLYFVFFSLVFVLAGCSGNKTTSPQPTPSSTLNINFDDSFHLNDSTVTLSANIDYDVITTSGVVETGTLLIPTDSQLGDIHQLNLNLEASGELTARYSVSRPFVILGRKDDISKARFADSAFVYLPSNTTADVGPVDIWVYRPYHLIVHFEPSVTQPQADNILANLRVNALSERRSFFDNGLIYEISTQGIGLESELKPIIQNITGVETVLFDIVGHSYF